MLIRRGYKTELDPNDKQRTLLARHAGAARYAYNWGLRIKSEALRDHKKLPSAMDLHKRLNALKKDELSWMYEVSKCAPQEALRDLDRAFERWLEYLRKKKEGKSPARRVGFPAFKSRKRGLGSFRLFGTIRVSRRSIILPRIGEVKLKECDYLPTKGVKVLSATISERAGRWFVSLQVEEEIDDPVEKGGEGTVTGIDLGIKSLASLRCKMAR